MKNKNLVSIFPNVLREQNFLKYWLSHLFATSGMWFWRTLSPILVFSISKDPRSLGILGLVSYGPVLFFSYGGGYLADHFRKGMIAAFFQTISASVFIGLGILDLFYDLTIAIIFAAALLESVAYSLCKPAIQAMVYDIVQRDDLTKAISINTTQYSIAQLIGPSLASLILFKLNASAALFVAASLYLPMIFVMIVVFGNIRTQNAPKISSVKSGSLRSRELIVLLISIALGSIAIEGGLRVLAPQVSDTLFTSAGGAGYLISSQALGGIFGVIFLIAVEKKFSDLSIFRIGSVLFGVSIFVYSLSVNFKMALTFAFLIGICNSMSFNIATALIHRCSTNQNRGRAVSLHSMALLGSRPLAGIVASGLSNMFGWSVASCVFSLIAILPGVFLVRKMKFG